MHGISTIKDLNEASAKSHEKAAWPDPVPAGEQAESVDGAALGKLTVPEVLPIMKRYKDTEGNSVGGSLHIVLDDGNVSDDSVRACARYAQEQGDAAGVELAEILLRMSKTQRKKLSSMFYDV